MMVNKRIRVMKNVKLFQTEICIWSDLKILLKIVIFFTMYLLNTVFLFLKLG